jgi:hypothetical protein
MRRPAALFDVLRAGFWGTGHDVKKWYWIGYCSPEEQEWPGNDLPREVEPMPKWVIRLAVVVIALTAAYATYLFFTT